MNFLKALLGSWRQKSSSAAHHDPKYAEAIRQFDPRHAREAAEGYYDRGLSHARRGEYDMAIADFSDAIQLNPNYLLAHNNRANCYAAKGDDRKAIAGFTEAIRLDPNYADGYYNRANSHARRGEHDKAVADYTDAIRLAPNMKDAYGARAAGYRKLGEQSKAADDERNAQELNSEAAGYVNRGIMHFQDGDTKAALADFDRAIELDPNGDQAYCNRGCARLAVDLEAAIADFDKAILINPKNDGAYYNRGVARNSVGDFDGAIADCTKSIELNPKRANAYYTRGDAWRQKGVWDSAISDYDQALAMNPHDGTAYLNRGVARYSKGDLRGAIADFSKAIDVNPAKAAPYLNRGAARLRSGDIDGAIADFDKTLEINPKDPDAYYNRGAARKAKGCVKEALDDCEAASKLTPLPESPEGYTWERAVQARAAFLRPRAWHFKSRETDEGLAYFITKEPIPPDAKVGSIQFETGFSIQVWQRVSQVKGAYPSQFAQAYVAAAQRSADIEIENTWNPSTGPFVAFAVQFHQRNNPDPLRQYVLLAANDATDTVYHIMFESPVRLWHKEWPVAEVVVTQLFFHPAA